MARNKTPFYDGYVFRRGRYTGQFVHHDRVGFWRVEVFCDNECMYETEPKPTKCEAYELALAWMNQARS